LQYVTEGWVLKKWTVECRNAEGMHTGEAIAAFTNVMIKNIPGLYQSTYKTITMDEASNMCKAMREALTIETHLRCVAHIINVCINKALEVETVTLTIQKCKDLATATH
jgi:hypothetical protein